MRILKKILLWLVIVIVAVSVLAQLLPAEWKVTRTVVVKAQPASIYPLLANVERWKEWNAFSTNDPAIQHFYPGTTVGVGAVDKWQSKKFGDGSATITSADPARGIGFDLRFERMPDQASPGAFEFVAVEGGTQVVYWVSGKHGHNPVHRIFGLFMGGFLGKFFDESLANIKKIAEANPVAPEAGTAVSTDGASPAASPAAAGGIATDPSDPKNAVPAAP